jgi:hypothetical protein
MTDADTSRNLWWQQAVQGDNAKIATWKIEATSSPGLQFYAYMQPGEAFMVLGHSMSTIYSTTTDISTLHGKIVLFTGDRKGTRECVPIILSPQSTFEWKKCSTSRKYQIFAFLTWPPNAQLDVNEDRRKRCEKLKINHLSLLTHHTR